MKRIQVDLGEAKYPVFIGSSVLENFSDALKKVYEGKKILLITDDFVWDHYGDKIYEGLRSEFEVDIFIAKGGKENKNFAAIMEIFRKLEERNYSRDSLIVAFGGGVVGDLAGFAASCWYRGMKLVHIPTTMLAMVDSCLGGKTAINFRETVNAIGSYCHPLAIFIDLEIARSLPEREIRSGFGEILKYGLICDAEVLDRLRNPALDVNSIPSNELAWYIERSLLSKSIYVKGDIYETDKRLILNFGHTLGHAMEIATVYNGSETLRHGEGVALGIVAIAHISNVVNGFSVEKIDEIREILGRIGLDSGFSASKIGVSKLELINRCMELVIKDKKRVFDGLRLITINEYSECSVYKTNDIGLLRHGFESIIR